MGSGWGVLEACNLPRRMVRTHQFRHDGYRLGYRHARRGRPPPRALLVYLTFGAPVARLVGRAARLAPRGVNDLLDVGLDWISQDPGPSAAVVQGLFFGRVAPPRSERALIETRSLIIGHPRDPVHPFSDADALPRELRNPHLVDANSIFELRLTPERLTNEIVRFIDQCWRPARAERARRRASA